MAQEVVFKWRGHNPGIKQVSLIVAAAIMGVLLLSLGIVAAGISTRANAVTIENYSQLPIPADQFLNSVGVNTHVNFSGPVFSAYQDIDRVKNGLRYLGVRHIRDGGYDYNEAQIARLAEVARDAHVQIDFTLGSGGAPDLGHVQANLHALLAAAPNSLSAVEGSNEINNIFMANDWRVHFKGQTTDMCARDFKAAIDLQTELYNLVKADPQLKTVPVYNFSVVYLNFLQPVNGCLPSYASDLRSIGKLPAISDFDNLHDYPFQGMPPRLSFSKVFARGRTQPMRPVVLTETGYSTGENKAAVPPLAVSEHVQAAYSLSALFDSYRLGARRTFLYELLDNNDDPQLETLENNYGLITASGNPKPAGRALHNLTTILADDGKGAALSRSPLHYSLRVQSAKSDVPVQTLLLQKSDGGFYLVLWVEPKLWNPLMRADLPAPATQTVTLTLPGNYKNLAVFDPLENSEPQKTLTDKGTVTIDLVDHPVMISFR